MDFSAQALANATKLNNDLFELVEKQRIQLNAKDEELAKDKQKNEKLSTDLALEKAQADKLKTELDSAQEMINIHQMSCNSWTSKSMEDQSNDPNRPTSSGTTSSADLQVPMLMQKMPITSKPQFGTPHPVFYPPQFGHPITTQFPVPPCSTGHLPMPIYQESIKDIKPENSENAKDGIYRNCLVCGDNNKKCGKHTGTGLQICNGCQEFFKRVVKTDADKKATFKCTNTKESENCLISKETRNSCEFCRFQACLEAGMDRQKIVELKAKREKKKGSGNDN